jgi:hypothetical protein
MTRLSKRSYAMKLTEKISMQRKTIAMLKKVLTLLILVPVIFALAACSSLKLPGSTSSTTSQNQTNMTANAAQPVEEKLAIGTLQLEGTDKAVTAVQAKELLPLWKAVKSLASDSAASPDEVTALYKQIQEAMTAEQVQAIKDVSLTPEEMQALLKKYGVEGLQGGGAMPNLTDAQKATMQARRSSNSSGRNTAGGDQGGGPGGGGGMPPDGGAGGGMPPDGAGQQSQPNAQGTPSASQGRRGGPGGGLNTMLVDPLIKILQERAG